MAAEGDECRKRWTTGTCVLAADTYAFSALGLEDEHGGGWTMVGWGGDGG